MNLNDITVKLHCDTEELDKALKKVDILYEKLETIKNIINKLNTIDEENIYVGNFYNYSAQQTQSVNINAKNEKEALNKFKKYVKFNTGKELDEDEAYIRKFNIDIK